MEQLMEQTEKDKLLEKLRERKMLALSGQIEELSTRLMKQGDRIEKALAEIQELQAGLVEQDKNFIELLENHSGLLKQIVKTQETHKPAHIGVPGKGPGPHL